MAGVPPPTATRIRAPHPLSLLPTHSSTPSPPPRSSPSPPLFFGAPLRSKPAMADAVVRRGHGPLTSALPWTCRQGGLDAPHPPEHAGVPGALGGGQCRRGERRRCSASPPLS